MQGPAKGKGRRGSAEVLQRGTALTSDVAPGGPAHSPSWGRWQVYPVPREQLDVRCTAGPRPLHVSKEPAAAECLVSRAAVQFCPGGRHLLQMPLPSCHTPGLTDAPHCMLTCILTSLWCSLAAVCAGTVPPSPVVTAQYPLSPWRRLQTWVIRGPPGGSEGTERDFVQRGPCGQGPCSGGGWVALWT